MTSYGRVRFDESAIAQVPHERVFQRWECGVALGGDGGNDVVVRREDGVGYDDCRERRAENKVNYGAVVSSILLDGYFPTAT